MTRHRPHPIDERLDEVERRLREVRRSLKSLAHPGGRAVPLASAPPAIAPTGRPPAGGTTPPRTRISVAPPSDRRRFQRYFASASFPPGLPPKEERRIQRNKILFIAVVVGFLVWLLYRLLAP